MIVNAGPAYTSPIAPSRRTEDPRDLPPTDRSSATTPAQFAATIRDDLARWSKVIKAAGIKVE